MSAVMVIYPHQLTKGIPMTTNKANPSSSYMAYVTYIKEEIGRNLTPQEHTEVMKFYTTGKHVDKCIEKLKGEPK